MFWSRSAHYEYWLYRRYRRRRQLGFGLLVLLLLVVLSARFHHLPSRHITTSIRPQPT